MSTFYILINTGSAIASWSKNNFSNHAIIHDERTVIFCKGYRAKSSNNDHEYY